VVGVVFVHGLRDLRALDDALEHVRQHLLQGGVLQDREQLQQLEEFDLQPRLRRVVGQVVLRAVLVQDDFLQRADDLRHDVDEWRGRAQRSGAEHERERSGQEALREKACSCLVLVLVLVGISII
jgi:hypothetical protein